MGRIRDQIRRLAALAAVMLLAIPVFNIGAQSPGSGLQISPTRHEESVEPGASKTVQISIKNVSGADIIARVEVNDFESDNRTGQPKINIQSTPASPNSIKNFLPGLEDISLANNETKNIDIAIDVPANTPAGAYYGVIRYQAVPVTQAEDSGNVSLTASVGVIMLIEVPGQITEGMELESLSARSGERAGGIFISAPNNMAISVKNTGNSFLKPFGRVAITDMRGREVHSYEVNNTDPRGNVLPNSSRIFTNEIKNVGSIGRYTATAHIGFGEGSEVSTITATFWVIPLWAILVLAAVLLLVIGGIVYLRLKLRKRKKAFRR